MRFGGIQFQYKDVISPEQELYDSYIIFTLQITFCYTKYIVLPYPIDNVLIFSYKDKTVLQ